jgi:predicted DsbA family dithiol-disulfide isomerase
VNFCKTVNSSLKTKLSIGILLFTAIFNLPLFAQKNKTETMSSNKIKIEIWSDIVCPFCFVGKKKMEQAITKLNAEDKVEIIWHSFQLDPEFPMNSSIPSYQYLSERKGYPIDQIKSMSAQLAIQGKDYGIDFQFDNSLNFNTIDAHRLLQWAKTLGKANELKEAFMVAHFSNGADLSNKQNILTVVKNTGLDTEKAKQVLDTDAYTQEVEQDIYQSKQLGIRGVPYFLINEKEVISGAQQDGVFESTINAALQNLTPSKIKNKEGICLPNGECK